MIKDSVCINTEHSSQWTIDTLRSHRAKSIPFHTVLRPAEDAHSACALFLCCFFILEVLQFVSQRITLWKSARFRVGWRWNLYPGHYTMAFAFSTILYPHLIRPLLQLATHRLLADGRDTGLPSFALQLTDGLGSVHLPTVLCPCNPHQKKGYPTVYHFGQGSPASWAFH